ncbi:hypothetical protein GCM10022408_06170 [Hymenobacter fastidiosus]|uniref:ISKra4 family transposase n=1 Tax=Hymenobacter fastidiosus TaxID=486264 RepID=A0ABP7RIY5_9BACT
MLGSRTSPYLQEKLALLSTLTVFGQVPELVEQLLGRRVNQSQAYRQCQRIADALDEQHLSTPSPALAAQQAQAPGLVYGMVDGSMLFTDQGWQETKLGRVFADGPADGPAGPHASEYVAHRGHYSGFTPHFERLLPPDSPVRKVFITDGAAWIGQWLSTSYPDATHILDYYHVVEKLAAVARQLPQGNTWLARQQQHLLCDESERVEAHVAGLRQLPAADRQCLGSYLRANHYRMCYGSYQADGLLIGSGPIEAAHRSVLQVRMKRSGQRWANHGCDHLLRLRVAYKSRKFDLVTQLLKSSQAKI